MRNEDKLTSIQYASFLFITEIFEKWGHHCFCVLIKWLIPVLNEVSKTLELKMNLFPTTKLRTQG